MKQVLLGKGDGKIRVAELPKPSGIAGGVTIQTTCSVISSGTERAAVSTASQSLLQRARANPSLVGKVLRVARDRGLPEALRLVHARLGDEMPMGYSLSGRIVDGRIAGYLPGTRVAAVGGGYACHAEVVEVPAPLVFPIPEGVDDTTAAFTAFGAIAMHGVRSAEVSLGHRVAIVGCGLVGLLAAQLLLAAGCDVYAFDPADDRAALARTLGVKHAYSSRDGIELGVLEETRGAGVDAIVVAAATKSSEPLDLAGALARDRARVVVVGDVGMTVPRDVYFAKELSLMVSRSYGPGRYDESYEVQGHEYPPGYVPWTERRNCEEFLRLAAQGLMSVDPLIASRHPIDDAQKAYEELRTSGGIAVVLTYDSGVAVPGTMPGTVMNPVNRRIARGRANRLQVAVIGGGEFARSILLPAFRRNRDVAFHTMVSATPVTADRVGREFGFLRTTTNPEEALDAEIDAVVVATRHDTHAQYASQALRAGKAVFVEKPLAINRDQLAEVIAAAREGGLLQVGFNRRFSSLGRAMKEFLVDSPISVHYRVNAGFVPASHWTRSRKTGGGRIIGEVCHFLDFLTFLVGEVAHGWHACALPSVDDGPVDNVAILLEFGKAGLASLNYVTAPASSLPKERIEGIGPGRAAIIEDFKTLDLWHGRKRRRLAVRQDKGFDAEVSAFVAAALHGKEPPISYKVLEAVTGVTMDVEELLNGLLNGGG